MFRACKPDLRELLRFGISPVGFAVTGDIFAGFTGLFTKVYLAHVLVFAFTFSSETAKRYCNSFKLWRIPSSRPIWKDLSIVLGLFVLDMMLG